MLGLSDEAVNFLEQAFALAHQRVDERRVIANQRRLAEALKFRDEHARAEGLFRDVVPRTQVAHLAVYRDLAFQHLGKCLFEQGKREEAVACFEKALTLRRVKGNPSLIDSTERALQPTVTQMASAT